MMIFLQHRGRTYPAALSGPIDSFVCVTVQAFNGKDWLSFWIVASPSLIDLMTRCPNTFDERYPLYQEKAAQLIDGMVSQIIRALSRGR